METQLYEAETFGRINVVHMSPRSSHGTSLAQAHRFLPLARNLRFVLISPVAWSSRARCVPLSKFLVCPLFFYINAFVHQSGVKLDVGVCCARAR